MKAQARKFEPQHHAHILKYFFAIVPVGQEGENIGEDPRLVGRIEPQKLGRAVIRRVRFVIA